MYCPNGIDNGSGRCTECGELMHLHRPRRPAITNGSGEPITASDTTKWQWHELPTADEPEPTEWLRHIPDPDDYPPEIMRHDLITAAIIVFLFLSLFWLSALWR